MITIERFRAAKGNSALIGFFDVSIDQLTLVINGMKLFKKDTEYFIGYPQKEYEKDGETKYINIVAHKDKDTHFKFQDLCINALKQGRHI